MLQITLRNARKVLMRHAADAANTSHEIEFSLQHGDFGVPTTVTMTTDEAMKVADTLLRLVTDIEKDYTHVAQHANKNHADTTITTLHPRAERLIEDANQVLAKVGSRLNVVQMPKPFPDYDGGDEQGLHREDKEPGQ